MKANAFGAPLAASRPGMPKYCRVRRLLCATARASARTIRRQDLCDFCCLIMSLHHCFSSRETFDLQPEARNLSALLSMSPADFAGKYDISAMPTFMFFHNGKLVAQFAGASEGKLRAHVEELAAM